MIGSFFPRSGLAIVMSSGVLTTSLPLPIKFSHAWRWEKTWLVYPTPALLLIPVLLASQAVPHLFSFYASLPPCDIVLPLLFGCGWGIAQATLGLSIACAGMVMPFAIGIGVSAVLAA